MNTMRSRKYQGFVVGVAVLVTVVVGTCGGVENCSQPKCASGAWMHIPMAVAPAGLVGSTVQVCRNDECYQTAMPDLPTAGGAGATLYFAGATFVLGNYWRLENESIGLDVEWHIADPGQAVDGDHYVVSLMDAAGAASIMLDKIATYQESERSPEECANGARCMVVELTP